MNIRELQNLLVNKGFNPYIDISNTDKVLIHLLEECGEITKAHRKGLDVKNEIGDVLILLCFYASSKNIDLQDATLEKIRENIKLGKFGLREKLEELSRIWKK